VNRDERMMRETLDGLLRRCVQCGLCLSTCATYLASGDETLSPRGRLMLLGDHLEATAADEGPAGRSEAAAARAWDLCLGCRACETACPSGIDFGLLDYAKQIAVDGTVAARRRLSGALSWPGSYRLLRPLSDVGQALLTGRGGAAHLVRALPGSPRDDAALCRRLDALSGLDSDPRTRPLPDPVRRGRVCLFTGCASAGALPGTQRRLIDVLEAAGVRVDVPAEQECCGALAEHAHNREAALRIARRNTQALAGPLAEADALIVEAAGCGAHLKEHPPEIADRTRDAVAYLLDLDLPPRRELPLRVALHDPCHARHAQGQVAEPRALLRRIPGLDLLEPDEADVCCGGAGPYVLFHPGFSAEVGRRKARLLADTGADLVVTTNPGCLGQIAAGLAAVRPQLPILPLTDLLWYALLTPGLTPAAD